MKELDNNINYVSLSVQEITDKFLSVKGVLFKHFMWQLHLNREDAEDMLQDVYYKVLNNRHRFRTDTYFNAWCYRIARNLFIDKYRVNKNNPHVDVEDDVLELMTKSERNGSEMIFLKEDINKAIESIKNPRDRRLAVMYYEGFKYEDMAEELKQPMGTIKNRLHIVKAHLAKELEVYNTK